MSKRRRKLDSLFPSPGLILLGQRLWTPGDGLRKPSPFARNLMGPLIRRSCSDCSGSGTCETCTCSACSDSPFYAPCCWKVVIAGIVDGSCSDCEVLNKTYYLSQDDPAGCTWSEGAVCGECDPTDIILTVTLDGSDYIITVTMDGHVWQKNYGTSKPECCGLTSETISHLTDSGDCDSSSATCVITALADGHACQTAMCTGECLDCCTDDLIPDVIQIVIAGVVAKDPDLCIGSGAFGGQDCINFNGTYVIEDPGCLKQAPSGIDSCWVADATIGFSITKTGAGTLCQLRIAWGFNPQDPPLDQSPEFRKLLTLPEIFDCVNFSDYSVPVSNVSQACDMSSATCLITAL